MRFILPILIGTLLLILWWTNPDETQFSDFLADEVSEIAGDAGEEAGGAMNFLTQRLGREIGDLAGQALGRQASGMFERESYGVASTYELDLNGRASGGTWKFVGVAGQFFPIEKPDDLETLVRNQFAR